MKWMFMDFILLCVVCNQLSVKQSMEFYTISKFSIHKASGMKNGPCKILFQEVFKTEIKCS